MRIKIKSNSIALTKAMVTRMLQSSVVGFREKSLLKVLSLLLLSNNVFGGVCQTSEYLHRSQGLCFIPQYRTYLSANCVAGKCEAISLIDKAQKVDKTQLGSDSRHVGSKLCTALGGSTSIAESKNKNQICVCEMPDQSAVACSRLGM